MNETCIQDAVVCSKSEHRLATRPLRMIWKVERTAGLDRPFVSLFVALVSFAIGVVVALLVIPNIFS